MSPESLNSAVPPVAPLICMKESGQSSGTAAWDHEVSGLLHATFLHQILRIRARVLWSRISTHTSGCMYVCMYIYIIYTYIYMCVYMHVNHIHIQKKKHISIWLCSMPVHRWNILGFLTVRNRSNGENTLKKHPISHNLTQHPSKWVWTIRIHKDWTGWHLGFQPLIAGLLQSPAMYWDQPSALSTNDSWG